MTAKESTVYDALLTTLASTLSGKTRLPNPYSIEDNPEPFLRDGYGVKVGSSSQGDTDVFREVSAARDFSVVLAREVFGQDTDSESMDSELKSMLEDQLSVVQDLMAGDEFGAESSINKVEYNGASEIEFILGDKKKLISSEMSFTIDVNEAI